MPLKGKNGRYYCPCCEYATLEKPAACEICPICFWKNDGAENNPSLVTARSIFLRSVANDPSLKEHCRQPNDDELLRRFENVQNDMRENLLHPCPSCGFLTYDRPPPNTWDFCPVCAYEDGEGLQSAQDHFSTKYQILTDYNDMIQKGTKTFLRSPTWRLESAGSFEMALAFADTVVSLHLDNKNLTEVPNNIWRATGLRHLHLEGNELKELPLQICQLKELEVLHLEGNALESLPEDLGNLKKLSHLSVAQNRLKTLPNSLGDIKNLNFLDLSHNRIETVPPSLGRLKNLRTLLLMDNHIRMLPESIGELSSLENLNLYHNQLQVLPDCLLKLTLLKKLDIRYNAFSTKPLTLDQISKRAVVLL